MSHTDADGLWQQTPEASTADGAGQGHRDLYTFKYDRGLVTLRLLVISKASWRSSDSFYTLESRWDGDTLYYRAPAGQWLELATLEDGRFVASRDGVRHEYQRIQPAEVADFSRAILRPDRPPFDYELTK